MVTHSQDLKTDKSISQHHVAGRANFRELAREFKDYFASQPWVRMVHWPLTGKPQYNKSGSEDL